MEQTVNRVLIPIVILFSLHIIVNLSYGVVVDGSKKKDISATKNQSHEKSMIDSFNDKYCGQSDQNFDEHEFVNMAREGQFPWMVSFQIKIPHGSSKRQFEKSPIDSIDYSRHRGGRMEDMHFCCGAFISDRWILSAAHCFAHDTIKNYLRNDKLKVVAGSHKVSSRSTINRNLTIKRIYYHSRFDKSMPVGFDIALVELDKGVKFSQKRVSNSFGEQAEPMMNTICLPLKDKRYKFNETARLAGWGLSDEKDATSMPSKLLTTDILIGKKDECVERYVKSLKSERPRRQGERYDDFICASYKNTRDACQSDSGGPLMEYADGKAVAIGVVSYGIGCATKGVPGLYTRTSAYINWIRDITRHGMSASTGFKLIEAPERRPGDTEANSTIISSTTTTRKPSSSSSSWPFREPSAYLPPEDSEPASSFKFFDQ